MIDFKNCDLEDVVIDNVIYRTVWKQQAEQDLKVAEKYSNRDLKNLLERLLFYKRIKIEDNGKIIELVLKDASLF